MSAISEATELLQEAIAWSKMTHKERWQAAARKIQIRNIRYVPDEPDKHVVGAERYTGQISDAFYEDQRDYERAVTEARDFFKALKEAVKVAESNSITLRGLGLIDDKVHSAG